MNNELLIILLCGVLALLYGGWTIRSVLSLSAGNARMQEIAAAIQEGAAEPGRPEIRIIQTRPPKAGAAKVRVAEIGFAQIGVI